MPITTMEELDVGGEKIVPKRRQSCHLGPRWIFFIFTLCFFVVHKNFPKIYTLFNLFNE